MLSITNESVDNIAIADYLGATVETSDGKIYGLRHLNNLWVRAREMAFVIDDTYSEPHGAIRYYAHTADLAGKTISKIRYILKNQPDLIINCEAYLPEITTATVKPQGGVVAPGTNVSIQMIFSDVPEEASYTNVVSVYKGSGRSRTVLTADQYNYSNDVLTIYATLSEGEEYHIVLSDANGKYSDIRADINVSETHYATTDMTYAEFYAGELGTTAEILSSDLDAISSATDHFDGSRFVQLVTSTDENGCNVIYGVKDVQVKMSKTVYDALTDDEKSDNGRYAFSTSTFDEYKEVATDGSFGTMVTETEELSDATVTVSSGASSTWGHYMLSITNESVDNIAIADYLGATVETSDGKIYGLRHLNNLWVRAREMAFVIDDTYSEPHGAIRYYAHTSDLAGKTISKIRYILKNQPDLIINCSAYLPEITTASVAPSSYGIMYGVNQPIEMIFSNVPSDANYDTVASLYKGSGRGRTAITDFTYSDNVLKINLDITDGQKYYATFKDSNGKYSDIRAEIYSNVANAGIIAETNNAVGLMFMLTPTGVLDEVDETLSTYKFLNATECTTPSDNYVTVYSSGVNQASNTGFTIDVNLSSDKIPEGYTPIVGFGYSNCVLTPDNLGSETFAKFYSYVNNITPIYGYRQIPDCSALNSLGIYVVAVQADGVSRDISSFTGAGATILDEENISLFYGTMIADCNSGEITEGEYNLSDEGENLISDGVRDNQLNISVYLAVIENDEGGNNNPPVVPQSTILTTPKIDVEAKASEIISSLKEANTSIPDNVEVDTLSDGNSTQIQRDISDVSEADRNYFSSISQDIAVVLPVIEVSSDKIYVFNVSLDNLSEGVNIFWHSMIEDVTGGFVKASDEDKSSVAVFYNNNGDEVTKVPTEKNIDVAAYFEAGKTYAPLITTSSSSNGGNNNNNSGTLGSSSSGCNSINIFASALILLSGLLISKKKNS